MIIPISHEDQQVRRLPWATILLIAANIAIFLLTSQLSPRPGTASVYWRHGYIPADPSLLALFTSMFLHAGWLSLLGNMLFLWLAGASLEDRWGRPCFLACYLACGVVAALIHGAVFPQSRVPMVGASGAIAGLMGAFLVRLAATRIRFSYWFMVFQGTFVVPAYVVPAIWLLLQFVLARSVATGGIAVWAHIGGFLFGAGVAAVIWLTGLETQILAPGVARKTGWRASDQLTNALKMLDGGEVDRSIQALVALLKKNPNSIEARATLVAAYTQKGDFDSAGRESARLVSAYIAARDMEGALTALEEHRRAHPGVAPTMRSLLTLAAYREKQERYAEAAELYEKAIKAWPDDLLGPKALVAYSRLMLEIFKEPDAALELLERARAHPKGTPEWQKVVEELLAAAQSTRPAPTPGAAPHPGSTPEASPLTPPEPLHPALVVDTGRDDTSPAAEPTRATPQVSEAPPDVSSSPPVVESAPVLTPAEALTAQPPMNAIAPPPLPRKLAPTSMQAVGIDARGLRLKTRGGATGILPWQQIVGLSAARIGDPASTQQAGDQLVLDLLIAPESTPDGEIVRCVRLSAQDLAIPQLQNEPSPLRGFQRFVATALKASAAAPYPSRGDCLGARGFLTFPDLAAYESALLSQLPQELVKIGVGE